MDKSKIIKIVGISLAILLIAIIFPLNLTYGSFNKTADLIITKEYNVNLERINVTVLDSNIEVRNDEINNIKIDIYDRSEKNIEITEKESLVSVTNKKECKNCEKSKVVITLPINYMGKINLITNSGDVNVSSINNLNVTTSSGNIIINEVSTFKGNTNTGNILIESLTNKIDYESVAGEVIITNALINEESNIETNTGRIEIESINNIRVRVTSFNSQASVKSNRNSSIILNVKTYNGIVDIK